MASTPAQDIHTPSSSSKSVEGNAIDELRLSRLDCLKIGIDADAFNWLRGSSDTLWRLRPMVFAALPDDSRLRASAEVLKEFGYRCWRTEHPLFEAGNLNRRPSDIFAGQTAIALLAIPEESETDWTSGDFAELG